MTAHVLILISNPEVLQLNDSDVNAILKHLPESGKTEWLSKNEAFMLSFEASEEDIQPLEDYISDRLSELPIDFAIRPLEGLKKKLLIADMDSTIIQQECIDEIADLAGLKGRISEITEKAMQGELDFEEALRERVGLLKGLEESKLSEVIDEKLDLTPGARTLVQTMRVQGHYCALVSGGFTFFTSRIAEYAGFHTNQANVLEIENGFLTGNVIEPILGREAKLAALKHFCVEQNISLDETLAVGDGANDLAMIEAAGLGVAFHAKPVVAQQADARVIYGDLTTLLFMQGYRRDEFVG